MPQLCQSTTPGHNAQQHPPSRVSEELLSSVVSIIAAKVEHSGGDIRRCALCPGVVDWHNYDIVLGALECGWGLFVQLTFTL